MKKFLGISLVAFAHCWCSWILFAVSIGIGMKSFDSPHILPPNETIWVSAARIMLLPIADPMQRLTKGMAVSILDRPSDAGVRRLTTTMWFFGPLVLNSVVWAIAIWWVYSRLARRFRRGRDAPTPRIA